MLILGIESSCDDTSVALLDCSERGFVIISETAASQIDIHKKYGGVVPEIAGRLHAEAIAPLIEKVLGEAAKNNQQKTRPDAIAVTAGPGLITALMVGVEAARTLSYCWNIPLVAVNHLEGHIHSVEIPPPKAGLSQRLTSLWLAQKPLAENDKLSRPRGISLAAGQKPDKIQPSNYKIQFPALALVVSGGHTELILMRDHGDYKILGRTKDDAAGECFDKTAKLLGLPYPGGPEISRLAETGNPAAINFPRPMLKDNNYDFSFAGLKTSARYWLRDVGLQTTDHRPQLANDRTIARSPSTVDRPDFCASLEQAIVDVLVAKTLRAAVRYQPRTVILCGGVAANKKLRQALAAASAESCPQSTLQSPPSDYCMDNGAMIAAAGYYRALKNTYTDWDKIAANPNWKIDELQ